MHSLRDSLVLSLVARPTRFCHFTEWLERSGVRRRILDARGVRDGWIKTVGVAPVALVACQPFLKMHIAGQGVGRYEQTFLVSLPEFGTAVAQDARVQVFRRLERTALADRSLSVGSQNEYEYRQNLQDRTPLCHGGEFRLARLTQPDMLI
jgi:hypothetical protein